MPRKVKPDQLKLAVDTLNTKKQSIKAPNSLLKKLGTVFRMGLILTGYTSTARYPYKPNESAMPNIIKLLEGIEFIDD